MIDIRTKFIHWYFENFQRDPLYRAMAETVEDSPWHRERSVAVHTDMVVSQYLSLQESSSNFDVRGAIGCAFHDVGKPPAEIIKFKPERGHYRAYHGHELVSARMWENWAANNWSFLKETFNLEPFDIYIIGWMIEHHVPWATKKDEKLNAFANTAFKTLGYDETWTHMLMADQKGRISDDSHQRITECEAWIDDLCGRVRKSEHQRIPYGEKRVFMLVGGSGVGKTTYRDNLLKRFPNAAVVNMDDLRVKWYGDDYQNAFEASKSDRKFGSKVDKVYIETLRENDIVILDNTNTSTKARRRWLAPARARDFQITAVLFPIDLETLLDRQRKRTDKEVPEFVANDMYERMQLPLYGDFDEVIVHDGNLK